MSRTAEVWADVMATHQEVDLNWGPTLAGAILSDPKRIAFLLSRYKFAAKMLKRCHSILDVGCGDGMGTLMFLQDTEATRVVGVDFEPKNIGYARDELLPAARLARTDTHRLTFGLCDVLERNVPGGFDGLSCLDVIEHIEPELGDDFIARLHGSLAASGVAVIGTPSVLAAKYGSVHSKVGHINLYDPERMQLALERKFRRVFIFSMNDEMVHTGFDKLAHYLMALCVK